MLSTVKPFQIFYNEIWVRIMLKISTNICIFMQIKTYFNSNLKTKPHRRKTHIVITAKPLEELSSPHANNALNVTNKQHQQRVQYDDDDDDDDDDCFTTPIQVDNSQFMLLVLTI
uniref:Uncharacterized protein n=1 Tax=Glossina palpalis gambiensis TaxID=67801 RepID=A0A1B0B1G2_9MUSC